MAKRLDKELAEFAKGDQDWVKVAPKADNRFELIAKITGPEGSPYEGGNFEILLNIPQEYPFKPPKATFITKIFHPSIGEEKEDTGRFCLGILSDSWSPQIKLVQVLIQIRQMLKEPETTSPLNAKAADLINSNKAEFEKIAREYTAKYAK